MDQTPFAVLLKMHRDRLHWSRADLARESRLSYPYISQLETGLRKPSRKAAFEIARALGVDAQVLEGSIPGDEENDRELQRAKTYTDQVMSRSAMFLMPSAEPHDSVQGRRGSSPADREDLLGDILDLLEEFDLDDRLEVLAEVQKRAMQRMLDERGRQIP